MNGIRGKRLAGIAMAGLTCLMVAGCASPGPKPARKPPEVVVPGVVASTPAAPGSPGTAGSRGTSGSAGGPVVSARLRRYGPAGSHGVVRLGGWARGGADNPVAAGALAYFRWLNARGGVYGREVSYQVLDDHGDARIVPSLAHQLAQGAAVFAVFGPADPAPDVAVARFLSSSQIPDVFTGSGCGCLNVPGQLPEVFSWPLEDVREGKILGDYVAQRFRAGRVALLYAPDGPGRAELAAFQHTAKAKPALREAVAGPVAIRAAVQAAGRARPAVVVALAPAAVSAQIAAAMRARKLRVPLVAAGSGLAIGLPDGVITDGFLPSPGAPAGSAAGSWITLFRTIRKEYLPQAPFSAELVDGMAAAYNMAAAMFRAGPALTRQNLVTALDGMPQGAAAGPLAYSLNDHSGVAGAYMGVVHDGFVVPAAGVMVTGPSLTQPVTPWSYQPQPAPPAGIPPL